jgi:vacuolar-type H+-ATPase subunit I/STV1
MIVRMKKLTVMTQTKDAFLTLKRLRCLGALHVENTISPAGKDIISLEEHIIRLGVP